jgi:hypothetical protein
MRKAARTAKRAPISRAQQIFSIRRRLAFLRELERKLKEQAAVLNAYKSARLFHLLVRQPQARRQSHRL